MAHFAEIDEENIVLRVLVVSDDQEHRGQEFLANDLGLGGTWIQCSYNNNMRKQYPGPGFVYNQEADIFISPKPYESWFLNDDYDWQSPVPYPNDDQQYIWDEFTVNWKPINNNRD